MKIMLHLNRILIVFTLVAFSLAYVSMANAQEENTAKQFYASQPCDNAVTIFKTITQYKEKLLFQGLGQQFTLPSGQLFYGKMMFFTNQETGSFTIVSVYPDGFACMVMSGKEFEPYMGEQPYDKEPRSKG